MKRTLNTRTKYRIVGSDYSSQEPRLTSFVAQDENMIKAFEDKKDLYAIIAQSAYDNSYEENLEHWPAGTQIELDGQILVTGDGADDIEVEINGEEPLQLKTFNILKLANGKDTQVAFLKQGDILDNNLIIKDISVNGINVIITFETLNKTKLLVKSQAKIKSNSGAERRGVGKVLLLASTYGMSGASAGAKLNKTPEEGQALLDNFFSNFKKVKQAIDNSKQILKEKGYVEDWAGRRRHLPDIYLEPYSVKLTPQEIAKSEEEANPFLDCADGLESQETKINMWKKVIKEKIAESQRWKAANFAQKNPGKQFEPSEEMSNASFEALAKDALLGRLQVSKGKEPVKYINMPAAILTANTGRKAQAERQCFNSRIQGGAASLTKLAMVNIFNDETMKQCNAYLIITVHDEVLVECPEYYAHIVEKRLPQIMIDAAKPYIINKATGRPIPMSCDPCNVTRWYSDEMAGKLLKTYGELLTKMSPEEAQKCIIEENEEFPPESIINVLNGTADCVEFE